MISDEAAAAARKADTLSQFDTQTDRIRAILEAAAPHIAAEAWERGFHDGGAEFEVANPYRSQA